MATRRRYTNASTSVPSPFDKPRPYQDFRPYASRYGSSVLTEKERAARSMQRLANVGMGGFGSVGNTTLSNSQNFFSFHLTTDFLELPQSVQERREVYRKIYESDAVVAQSIDLHTELPLSKIRLAAPKPYRAPKGFKSPSEYGKYILNFFQKMCDRVDLLEVLLMAVHHYWLDGVAPIFAEDSQVDVPEELGFEDIQVVKEDYIDEDGNPGQREVKVGIERPDREDLELAYFQRHYKGWERLIVLPIEQLNITTYSFTNKCRVELIPNSQDKALIEQAKLGDPISQEMVEEIPEEVRDYIEQGQPIPLGTDPDEGSFVYLLQGRRSAGSRLGRSILDRCLNDLLYREKLRQAQTQIASRAMTPKRIVWAEGLSEIDTDDLRAQVDLALMDPDYSIVTNYEVRWEEMGARDRLLDIQTEYEYVDRRLYAGLGVTEGLLSGESMYSGDRLNLEIINNRYILLRERLQKYVHEFLFKPVARRKGFVEIDEWGDEVVLIPTLSFTRLPLRDSQDIYDQIFNLYSKGSIPVDYLLDLLNIDAEDARAKLERDMFTVNDATFNEVVRGLYSSVSQPLADKTNLMEKLAEYMGLEIKPGTDDDAGMGRF